MIDLVSREEVATKVVDRLGSKGPIHFSARVIAIALLNLVILTPWTEQGSAFWRGALFALSLGLMFGLLVAVIGVYLAPKNEFDQAGDKLERIFAADPAIVVPAPADATHRVIGSIIVRETMERVPGILYVTGRGLVFQSHIEGWEWVGRLKRPRFRVAQLLSVRTLVLEDNALLRSNWIAKVTRRTRSPLLTCSSEDGEVLFQTVQLDRVKREMQVCVDRLRATAMMAPRIPQASSTGTSAIVH